MNQTRFIREIFVFAYIKYLLGLKVFLRVPLG